MILVGSSYSAYRINMGIAGGATPPDDEIDETFEALRDVLFEKYLWLKTINYLDEFYRIIESENTLKGYVIESCRQ